MTHVINTLNDEKLEHAGMTPEQFDTLTDVQKVDIEFAEANFVFGGGTQQESGFATKNEAYRAAFEAGITNPGVITRNNRFFFTDPKTELPTGTWGSEFEAEQFASSISRPDLIPVWDSSIARFRLEEPPNATPAGPPRWIPEVGKFEVTLSDGRTQLVDPAPGQEGGGGGEPVPIPGTDFVMLSDGRIVEASRGQGEVVTIDGRQFTRDTNGNLHPLADEPTPSMDELIVQAIIDGNAEAAVILDDFRNRPNSLEFFQAALAFARSPGDVATMSALASGQISVTPPPAGQTQRIAAQPQFLQDSFQNLIRQASVGGASSGDIVSALQAAGVQITQSQKEAATSKSALEKNEEIERKRRDKELTDENARLQTLLDAKPVAGPTTEGGSPLGGTPGTRVLDADARFKELVAAAEARPERFQEPTTEAGTSLAPGPGGTRLPEGRLTNVELARNRIPERPFNLAEPITEPTTFTADNSGFFTGLNAPGEDDFLRHGGTFDDRTAIVGENGPELAVLPVGTQVLSNKDSRKVKSVGDLRERLRHGRRGKGTFQERIGAQRLQGGGIVEALIPTRGILESRPRSKSLAGGSGGIEASPGSTEGIAEPLLPSKLLTGQVPSVGGVTPATGLLPLPPGGVAPIGGEPFGVTQALRGGTIEPTRRRLARQAGLPILSPQALQNLSPSERAVLDERRQLAGITAEDFAQELASAQPGRLRSSASRFAARIRR